MESPALLVLEDDESLRTLVAESLEDEGYRVDTASHGREAIDKVLQRNYALLVIDVRMEGISGLEAFSLIKQRGVQVACLVITGYATEEDSIRAVRLGVGDYLRKPFQLKELLTSVARLLALHHHQQEQIRQFQELRQLTGWLIRRNANGRQPAGEFAYRIAHNLGLQEVQCCELQLAAMLAGDVQQEALPAGVSQSLQCYTERWDGSGPRGLRGEEIPLESRIVALSLKAAACLTQGARLRPDGEIDPYLLEHLEWDADRPARQQRLLSMARMLQEGGDGEGAAAFLQQAEMLGLRNADYWLTKARLSPPDQRVDWLEQAVLAARHDPGPTCLEAGLTALESNPLFATRWLEQAAADPRSSNLARLALWRLGRDFDPGPAMEQLLHPEQQPSLVRALPWLFPRLVRWWAERQPDRVSETSPAPLPMARLLRNYGRLLLPRWNELSARSKEALLELLPAAPWAVPLLEQLGQEPTEQLRRPAQNRLQAVQPSAEEPLPLLRFHSLGGFEVWIGTERVPEKSWRGNRNKYLFAYLACSQRPVSEDRLIDLFWEEDLEKGKRGLYNSISHLRKILSAVAPLRDGDYNALLRAGEQIGINPGLEQWHDRVEVERALAEFRKTPALESAEALLDALALVHGPMLDGCFLDWALDLRNSLEQKLIEGAGQLAEWLLANGHTRRLPDLLNRGLEIDPCSHALMRVCLKAALLDGNTGEALRKYELFAKRLKADLELEPSLELVELYQRVRAHV